MNIAYLIIAHDNPIHLQRLVTTLTSQKSDCYIHIDRNSKNHFRLPKNSRVHIITNPIRVYWGGFSFIEAVLKLVAFAQKNKRYDYFVLLSGTSYPIRSNAFIQKFLTEQYGKEYINISPMPTWHKPLSRIEYYYLETDYDNKIVSLFKRLTNRIVRILDMRRKLPDKYMDFKLYGGSTWWILSSECMSYIMTFIHDNPEFFNFFKKTLIPDEIFFQTIIGNSQYADNIHKSATFADWTNQTKAHPEYITEKHLEIFKVGTYSLSDEPGKFPILFARKFSDMHTKILDIIDAQYRI